MKNKLKSQVFITVSSIFLVFCLVLNPLANSSQRIQKKEIPQEITREMNRISRLLQPTARQKAERAMKSFQQQAFSQSGNMNFSEIASESLLAEFMKLSAIEMDVLVSWIMFETAQAAEEDIKELLEEMHKMNEAKQKLRRQIQQVKQKIPEFFSYFM